MLQGGDQVWRKVAQSVWPKDAKMAKTCRQKSLWPKLERSLCQNFVTAAGGKGLKIIITVTVTALPIVSQSWSIREALLCQ